MSRGPRYRVPLRRRREGKTDYRLRLGLLRGGRPRAVVRFTNRRVLVAVTDFDPTGDRVLAAADSQELTRVGFPERGLASTPAAYLTGYLAGLRAKAAGRTDAILDAGLRRPASGGRLLSALKGLLDAGVEIPHGEKGFPSADRLNGSHLTPPLPKPLEAYRLELVGHAQRPSEAT
ncbi:MAG TPA: 50S ribosomal protein L18 [Thermoplasmata archaeon]|nr:50S ribosomal protein L18 [Thermoplasmata archaeon]